MQVIAARLSARYNGRIEEAELSLGDAVLVIRDYQTGGDGSVVLLDAAEGVLPRNWMPAGCSHEQTSNGYRFIAHKGELTEVLEVFIDQEYTRMDFPASMVTHLHKLGAEKEFAKLIADNLSFIEPGLQLIGQEVRTPAGPIDIMAIDKTDRIVIIEVKRRRATLTDLYQLRRYHDNVHADSQWGRKYPRGMIIAPSATRDLLTAIEEAKRTSFLRLSYEQLKNNLK